MKSIPTTILFVLLGVLTQAQVVQNISPAWAVSNGNRDHTSRDELRLSATAPDQHWVVAASVERDSTFADLRIQKMAPDGQVVWTFNYTSGMALDYDIPLKMLFSPQNDLYLLASAVNFTAQGAGYLLKISADGDLLWQQAIPELTIEHDYFINPDWYLDPAGNVVLTYTCGREILPVYPIYFFQFSPAGEVLSSVVLEEAFNPYQVWHNAAGEFVFLVPDQLVFNTLNLKRVNPLTGVVASAELDLSNLPADQLPLLAGIDWSVVKTAPNGDVVAASNANISAAVRQFFVLRMTATGVVKYIYSAAADLGLSEFQDLVVTDTSVVLVGAQEVALNYSGHLWTLNAAGQLSGDLLLTQNGAVFPQSLLQLDADPALYVHASSIALYQAFVFKINANNAVEWTHTLSLPPGYDFGGSHLLTAAGTDQLLACGTLYKRKHANSVYYSEEDVFVENFTPNAPGFNWQQVYNGESTSYVITSRLSVSPQGRSFVVTEEKTGPEPSWAGGSISAPVKNYLYCYNSSGELLWSLQMPAQVIMSHFYEIATSDPAGNVYLPCYKDINNQQILKINSAGIVLDSVVAPGTLVRTFTLDNGHVYIFSDVLTGLDANFQVTGVNDLAGLGQQVFQLPGSSDVYALTVQQDSLPWQVPPRLYLYRNGTLDWVWSAQPGESVGDLEVLPEVGQLIAQIGSSSGGMSRVWRIPVNGAPPMATPVVDAYAGGVFYPLRDGRFYLYASGKLFLFDANLTQLAVHDLPAAGYVFRSNGDYLAAFTPGSVSIFDFDGVFRAHLLHPDFEGFIGRSDLGQDLNVYAVKEMGEQFFVFSGGGYNFGWRWARGVLQKFDTEAIIEASSTQEPASTDSPTVQVFPNPASEYVQVRVPLAWQGRALQLQVSDSKGATVFSQTMPGAPALLVVPCGAWPAGAYSVLCRVGEAQQAVQCVKQ